MMNASQLAITQNTLGMTLFRKKISLSITPSSLLELILDQLDYPSTSSLKSPMMNFGNVDPLFPQYPKIPSKLFTIYRLYGGIQEYLSISIVENTIRFAAQKGVLNTLLSR
jgi:hypothetical protein